MRRNSALARIFAEMRAQPAAPQVQPPGLRAGVAGNRILGRWLQARLTVNQPGDHFEQEADRVADLVVGGAGVAGPITPLGDGPLQRCGCGGTCNSCQAEEDASGELLRSAGTAPAPEEAPPLVHAVMRTPGTPLDSGTRDFMESRFGDDFSAVRVHADARAAESATAVRALAYTVGPHVVFGPGQFQPGTSTGRRLLAHELTHVLQQRASAPAAGRGRVQRSGAPASAASTGLLPLVIDDEAPASAPGQQRKSAFLRQLHDAVCAAANQELARARRSTDGCPYLEYWFGLLARRDAAFLLRVAHRFAPESGKARTAAELIPPIARRIRRGVAIWVATGQVTGVPPDLGALLADEQPGAERVQRLARPGATEPNGSPAAIRQGLGAGHALEPGVRGRMESAFGADFSRVRVHADAPAAQLSTRLGARAFTVGEHVAFDHGQYQPGTLLGDALLAHELAHVVQQGEGDADFAGANDLALERDADRSAVGVVTALWRGMTGGLRTLAREAMPRLRAGVRLQRCKADGPVYCPRHKKWAVMNAPAGVGPVCVCRWHCVYDNAGPSVDSSGNTLTSLGCPPDVYCPRPRYADDDEVFESQGEKKHSEEVPSPTSTGVGAHFTPLTGENACGCIPPSDIAGAGATVAPLMAPGMELTDFFPHAGSELMGGGHGEPPPVERNRIVIEGPAVAGQPKVRTVAPAPPAELPRGVVTETRPAPVASTPTAPVVVPEVPIPVSAGKSPAPIGGGGPNPLTDSPGARTVWGTWKSKIYHEEGSSHFEKMKTEQYPNEKGHLMTAAEAEAAGYRPAQTGGNLDKAREGTAKHEMVKQLLRQYEGTKFGELKLVKVERTVGGKKRVDEMYVDDGSVSGRKRVFVFDTFTGPVEPAAHNQKGWDYSKEPQIKALIDQGYEYYYAPGMMHPDWLH